MKQKSLKYFTLALSAILCLTSAISNAVTFKEIRDIIYDDSSNEENKSSEIQNTTNDDLAQLKGLVDTDGSTLLHHAALTGFKTLVEYLIEAGVDVNVTDNKKQNALHYIAIGYDVFKNKKPKPTDENKKSVIKNYTEIAKLLLEKNINFTQTADVKITKGTYKYRDARNIFSQVGLENINLLIQEKEQVTINNLAGSLSQLAKG